MHVGPEKGKILISALKDSLERKMTSHSCSTESNTNSSFVAVEVGTYCTYASILMGRAICETKQVHNIEMDCHLFTAEINPAFAKIAAEIIQTSGMDDLISVHEISYNGQTTDIVETVADAITKKKVCDGQCNKTPLPMIDFLFIDHDKGVQI